VFYKIAVPDRARERIRHRAICRGETYEMSSNPRCKECIATVVTIAEHEKQYKHRGRGSHKRNGMSHGPTFYRTIVDAYPKWQAWMHDKQPGLLLIWGRYDLDSTSRSRKPLAWMC
jgi:hypothetical protein